MTEQVIAIDGPSASGKSSVSRLVAGKKGFVHVDSGAVYRGITWALLQNGLDCGDAGVVTAFIRDLEFDPFLEDGSVRYRMAGRDPGSAIRSREVNDNVSQVAAVPDVREWVVARLREMTCFGGLVMEGRDIGTAVFPDAAHKFYLDATPEERARRRFAEDERYGERITRQDVQSSLAKRDKMDSTRKKDPLRAADDALIVDTTGLSLEDVADLILKKMSGG